MSLVTTRWRMRFIVIVLALLLLALLWRLFSLTVLHRDFLLHQGDVRTIRIVKMPAYRGMITDRRGEPLAVSTPVESVWINPKEMNETSHYQALAKLLTLTVKDIQKAIAHNQKKEFIYLKRRLNPELAAKVKALQIPGVYLLREYKRYYPEGEVTAHLIGFTDIDDHGQEGMELVYNQWLQGIAGKKRVLKDRYGHIIDDIAMLREAKPGRTLVLSIDRRIQYLAYRALKKAVMEHHATSGSAIVLDTTTGEVLAMVNQPSYNPNNRPQGHSDHYRNRVMTDLYEPGSTLKTFSVASALMSGKYTPNSQVDTNPGWMMVQGKRVQDVHNKGKLSLSEILQYSSNVGITKVTLSLPLERLWHVLRQFGFGETTGSHFPGESAGVLPNYPHWQPFIAATLAFGYGMSATPAQLANAYAVIANHGVRRPLSLVRQQQIPLGNQIMPERVANQIMQMLCKTVTDGTGRRAKVVGYKVAGKTGTARLAGQHGYDQNRHMASFIGIAPATHPKLVVAVVINEPKAGVYYGSGVAAPVFATIMSHSLRLLNSPPDNLA